MVDYLDKAGLKVDPRLVAFVETEALAGTRVSADQFWDGFAELVASHSRATANYSRSGTTCSVRSTTGITATDRWPTTRRDINPS